MADYLQEKLERYRKKLKRATKHGEEEDAAKYAAKVQAIESQIAAERDDDDDSTTDDDDDDEEEVEDRSFVLEEEPDLAPKGLKGASKLDWLAGRGAKKLLARACRSAVEDGGARDGFEGNDLIRIALPDHLELMWDWLRKLGFAKKLAKFALKMNRAAEASAKKAFRVFADAVLGLDFSDARSLATAEEPDAITTWLEATCSGDLTEHFKAIVRDRIEAVTFYWKRLKRYWNKADRAAMGAVPDFDEVSRGFDPVDHVVDGGLKGLFTLARSAEKIMRATVGDLPDRLIKAVFTPFKNFFSLVKRPLKKGISENAKVKKNPVTLALRKARKARKRAKKWFAATFEDESEDEEDEPLGPNMDASEDMDGDDQLENGDYVFKLAPDGTGRLTKAGVEIWSTTELDFDPYSTGDAGGCVARVKDGCLRIEDKDGEEMWSYGDEGGPATTLVLSDDGGLALTTDDFEPVVALFDGDDE